MELLIRLDLFNSECRQNSRTRENHISQSKIYKYNTGYIINERLNHIIFRFADNKEPYKPRVQFNSKYDRVKTFS